MLLKASRAELDGLLEIRPSNTGMHVIGWLPEGVDDQTAFRAAFANGVESHHSRRTRLNGKSAEHYDSVTPVISRERSGAPRVSWRRRYSH